MRRSALRVTIVVATLAVLLGAQPSRADLSLNVQPARYEMQVSAGGSQTIPVVVRNDGDAPTHVIASMNDFSINGSGQYAFLPPGATRFSAGKWSTVNPREFDLAPGAFQQLRYTVDVPHGAAGEYSALIFFTTRRPRQPGAFVLTERVASRMYVLVGDTANVSGDVADVSSHAAAGGRRYSVTFKNTGNMHVFLSGHIEVKAGDVVVDRLTMPESQIVERGGIRVVDVTGKALAPGTYSATAVVDYGGSARVAGQTRFTVQ
jgi:P pilus assembly chaperone PapD